MDILWSNAWLDLNVFFAVGRYLIIFSEPELVVQQSLGVEIVYSVSTAVPYSFVFVSIPIETRNFHKHATVISTGLGTVQALYSGNGHV